MDVEQRLKARWWLIGAALALLLAAAGWFWGRPAYRQYKVNRSLTQARAFLQKGDYRNEILCLRQALQANPVNREATRLMAELMFNAQSPGALGWWRRMVELDPSPANKLLYAASALHVEKPPFPIAAQVVEELQATGGTNAGYHLLACQLALRLGRLEEAESHLQAAGRLEPTNRLHQLNLATLQLKRRDPSVATAARQELVRLSSDGKLGAPALRSLIADALERQQTSEAEDFSRRLLALPQAVLEDRMQQLTILDKAKSAELNGWVAKVQQEASTNALQVARVITWLDAHQRAGEALSWLASLPPNLRSAPPLPLMEAKSLLTLKDWAGLEARLTEQRWEEQEFLRLALLSRALREQGRREIAGANWQRAVSAAGTRTGFQAALVQVAASWGWTQEVDDLLWAIAKREPGENWAWQSLQNARMAAGDSAGLYRIYTAKLERDPGSIATKNNAAMLGLLLNRDVEKAAQLAREVYEAGKTNAFYVSTYAFALHVQGRSAEGLKLMQALPEAALEKPEIATYYAVLLTAAGQSDKAAPYLAVAEKAQLLPEERRLLKESRSD